MTRRFRELYGAGPFHLLPALAAFAIAAYALSRALSLTGRPERILLWLGACIVAHDLVLLPLYALLGRLAAAGIAPQARLTRVRVAALNHVRFAALGSGLLLLVWFPLVADKAPRTFMRATGLSADVYFDRWLLLTAALFAGSTLVFAVRVRGLSRGR